MVGRGGLIPQVIVAALVVQATGIRPSAAVEAAAPNAADEARAYHERATAAFALGHYDTAAEWFEKAFDRKPDPAELYNAAQSHRLAGNRDRALMLYRNYLRVFPRGPQRSEVETRIRELRTLPAETKPASDYALDLTRLVGMPGWDPTRVTNFGVQLSTGSGLGTTSLPTPATFHIDTFWLE